jgi:hypothetical protein
MNESKQGWEKIIEEFANLIGCDYTGKNAVECNFLREKGLAFIEQTIREERDGGELEEAVYMGKKFKDMSRREILEAFEKHDGLYRAALLDEGNKENK